MNVRQAVAASDRVESDVEALRDYLRKYALEHGIVETARAAGCNSGFLSRFVRGERSISADRLATMVRRIHGA